MSNYYKLVSLLTEHQPQQNLRLDLNDDIQLGIRVISDPIKPMRGLDTAIGLEFSPQSTQEALNIYLKTS